MKSRKGIKKSKLSSNNRDAPSTGRGKKTDPLYLFYYSLFTEDPSNKMARSWLIDNGYLTRYNMSNLENELSNIAQKIKITRSRNSHIKTKLSPRSIRNKKNKYSITRYGSKKRIIGSQKSRKSRKSRRKQRKMKSRK
jgi:hypothetical protein